MTIYLERNLNVARVIGASAGAKTALARLLATKNPPKWLIQQLEGIESRLVGLSAELAAWRDIADDAPYYVIPSNRAAKLCAVCGFSRHVACHRPLLSGPHKGEPLDHAFAPRPSAPSAPDGGGT